MLALRRGDLAGAEREIRAAIDEKPDVRLAHYNLALLAEQQGDLPRAIAEYQKEIELHPNSYKAAFNLGRLYERAWRSASADRRVPAGDRDEPDRLPRDISFSPRRTSTPARHLDEAVRLARSGHRARPATANTRRSAITSSPTCFRGRDATPKLSGKPRAARRSKRAKSKPRTFGVSEVISV